MSLSARLFSGSGGELGRPSAAALFPRAQVAAVVLVAALFRLLYWHLFSESAFMHTPVVDGSFFDIWARTMAEGRMFQDQTFFKPPMYAYLLSFFYRLGFGMSGVLGVQTIVGIISCVLTLAMGRVVFQPRVAFGAAVVTALLPILPFFEMQLLAESWTMALTLGALLPVLLVLSGKLRPRARYFALAGVSLGIAALGRPNLMLVVVVIAGCLWWWGRHGGRLGLMGVLPLLVGFFISISPVTISNLKHGEFVLISANLGANLYAGQSDNADGISAIPVGVYWDDLQLRSQQAGALEPGDASRYLTGETLKWMQENPGRTLKLWLKKAVLVVNAFEPRNNINPLWLARQDGVFVLARWWPATWLMLPFALVGLIWAGRGTAPAWLLKWLLMSQAVAILPFFVAARFRAPLLPLLALFAAAGLVVVWQAIRGRRWVPLVVLVVAAVFVNVDWYGLGGARWLARDHFNQGVLYARAYGDRAPDTVLAEQHLRQSLALDPLDAEANENLGVTLLGRAQPLVARGRKLAGQGEADQAEIVFTRAVKLLSEAEILHQQAVQIFPRSYRSWGNLAACQMWWADIQALRVRAQLAAGNEKSAKTLALDAMGRYEDTSNSLGASLQVNPKQPDLQRRMQMVWPAVLALPDLDPAIGQAQEHLKRRMQSGR